MKLKKIESAAPRSQKTADPRKEDKRGDVSNAGSKMKTGLKSGARPIFVCG